MAVNIDYFGAVGTWETATTESLNQQFKFKVANWNPSDSTIGKGDYKYKFGELFNQTGEYTIDLDISTAYCAMDKDAPFVHRLYTSARYDATRYHSRIDLAPVKDTPIGWYAGSIPTYMVILPEGYATDLAPVNFKPIWEDPAWHPTLGTSNGQRTLGYIGSINSPVLSFPFKSIKLVPIVRCCAFKAGKTKTDLESAVTYTDFASVVDLTTEKFVPLGTFVNDSYNGTPFYDAFPVICSLYVAPVLLYFDNDGNLAVPPGCTSKYNSTSMRSYGSMRETLHVDIFPSDKVDFAELISRLGTVYSDASCDARLFPAQRMPSNFVQYGYNGNSYPSKSLNVYEQGAFCIGGGCVTSVGNYNFMYIRAIDPDTFKVYADTADADIACGVLVDDFGTMSDFVEYVRKSVAYFGMFFSDDVEPTVEEKSTMDTAGLHLGVVDENGVTHGQYTTGDQNPTAPNYTWEDPMDDTPYNPGGGGGGGDTEDPSDPYTPYPQPENGFGVGLKHYAIRRGDLQDLIDWIYYYTSYDHALDAATQAGTQADFNAKYPDPAAWVAHVCERAGYNVFPTNDIVGVMAFPFDLSGSDAGYMLGHWDTSIYHDYFHELADAPLLTGKLLTTGYKLLNMGSHDIQGRFGDYRDYPPYSRLELQVPYHGTVDLEPADWIGKTVSVSIIVDLLTGSSLAIVSRVTGGVSTPVITMPGQMGISVPITADNAGQTANTFAAMSTAYQTGRVSFAAGIAGDVISAVQGTAGAILGAATLDAGGVISSAPNVPRALVSGVSSALNYGREAAQQVYEMQHIASGKMVMGAGSPSTSFAYEYRCRIVYHYPTILSNAGADSFAGVLGHACNSSGRIGEFSGFTKFGAADLSGIPCTADEQQIILDLLQNGIFL